MAHGSLVGRERDPHRPDNEALSQEEALWGAERLAGHMRGKAGDPSVRRRNVADMGHSVERNQVMFTGTVQLDVLHQDELVVMLVEGSFVCFTSAS